MSSSSIRDKIKSGLSKAITATGSSSSKKIYKLINTNTGGSTPLDIPVLTTKKMILVNAMIKSYKTGQFNDNIRSGDKILVSDSDVSISEGDIVRQGATDYLIIYTNINAPTSDVLVYVSQIRAM